ncbi:MAG: 6-bladed beta-propeller [Bacteroidota bacterium]|nr:6-bladed beta-propeller [Bacteroidota bacterium]MXW14208.1 6-bladed beta-propeller [Rhodothermaceae bacterium]MDE2644227.1 6-bladed beta-propeller [Bacteroidota bacterium]MXW32610.1 6-bladed beta-propeller [Rhodothermaceae bacterium]MYC03232.1 6-bladed beta-propeller [Rhodothermaceae bacterium]
MKISLIRNLFFGVGLLIPLLLVSCQAKKEDTRVRFGRFFLDQLSHQSTSERRFVDVSYEEEFTITSTTEFVFYNISQVVVGQNGSMYVLDHGITKTHKFSPSGEYLMTYGYGFGEGPGELLTLIDFGITSDSTVYMMDSTGRKISFYSMDGTFLRSKPYDDQIYRYTQTLSGREYILSVNPPTLIETRLGSDTKPIVRFSDLTPDLEGVEVPGPLGTIGPIMPYGENLVYALERYPLLIQYAPDGSLVYARTTVDYDDSFEEPEMETNLIGGYRTEYLSGPTYAADPLSITGTSLFLLSSYPPREAIDVYEAETGEYQYSMHPPGENSDRISLTIQDGRVYETSDTTVTVWEIIY